MTSAPQHTLELRRYIKMFWRWRLLFVASVVLLPTAAYFLSQSQAKSYESTILMQIQAPPDVSLLEGSGTAIPTEQVLQSSARLVQTNVVATAAADRLRPRPKSAAGLLDALEVTPDAASGFLSITASGASPSAAAAIANAFGETIVARRASATTARFERAIKQLEIELGALPASDRTGRRQLSQQVQRLRALRASQGNGAQIVERARPSDSPVSPRPIRTTALALIAALLIAIGLVLLANNIDRRIRNVTDLEELSELPLLSVLPKRAFEEPVGDPDIEQPFQTLRTALTYFNIDHGVGSVMVTSPVQGDGKTTVATNLAYAFAKAGNDVIIVDADLRRPRVGEKFGLPAGPGLGSLIVGESQLEQVLHEVRVESATQGGRLRVLPAGPPPPNPSELLSSARLRDVVGELKERSEILIVDSSPVLAVSDALPLVDQVAGVVVVIRLNRTTSDALQRLKSVLTAARGNILGIVATDAPHGQAQGYGYGHGYYGAGYTAEEPKRRFGRNRVSESNGNGPAPSRVARRADREEQAP